jgi:hypothetical protein
LRKTLTTNKILKETIKMKIINKVTNEVAAIINTNRSMTLDEAIELVGEIVPESENENVIIDGKEYFYDDLEIVYE